MTEETFREEFDLEIQSIFNVMRKTLPYDTGRLANYAYKITKIGNRGYDIWIDPSIAPYVTYLDKEGSRTGKEYLGWDEVCYGIISRIKRIYGTGGL